MAWQRLGQMLSRYKFNYARSATICSTLACAAVLIGHAGHLAAFTFRTVWTLLQGHGLRLTDRIVGVVRYRQTLHEGMALILGMSCNESLAGGCRRFAVGEVRVMELLRRAGERPPAGDFEALSFWVCNPETQTHVN